jgi:hypothetical protein
MKMAVFWAVSLYILVEIYLRFGGACCRRHSETSVNFYQTTQRKNPEDGHLHTRSRENLISQKQRSL